MTAATTSPSVAHIDAIRRRRTTARRTRTIRRAVFVGILIAGGHPHDGPVPVDDLDVAQDPGGGLRGAPDPDPAIPQWQNYPDMWNSLPFGSFFLNSIKLSRR